MKFAQSQHYITQAERQKYFETKKDAIIDANSLAHVSSKVG
jgi:hypothetical protein